MRKERKEMITLIPPQRGTLFNLIILAKSIFPFLLFLALRKPIFKEIPIQTQAEYQLEQGKTVGRDLYRRK